MPSGVPPPPPTSATKAEPGGDPECLPLASSAWRKVGIFPCWRGPLGHQQAPQLGTVPEECTRGLGKASPQRQGLAGQPHCSHDGKGSRGISKGKAETQHDGVGPGSSSGCPWYPDAV